MTDGRRLENHLVEIGMKYCDLAKELGHDRSFVTLLLRRNKFQVKTRFALCRILNLTPEFFCQKSGVS
ncbi:MAG: hypothetical protein A3G33_08160 [Omnitrophica bacterium RIFCSPLOWO2_12_FULL_44_17]|uniref:HTH cro/C1-type domain-containing protein n=1 Tax=Candidatus Danuiimicrobium aquiferis TaxID=1801832 RepID=A0A1G1KXY2_9BACT|nr:MAG: hypothetical protein A3B72_05860 [Omnitrophica bacterium RIFCSPHIGHO2_02_FULL_45_28]OGW89758.1 MAG: hypothetical protein A3E74_06325 [Omnitrophica bacterium RIFCSPHIGHO2_12_FULL_44_12]OGW97776.1 MAG: hypothetical protein A3G33_08160 [Omnitrophica bacterium RIFCSPLOWO2_12_FULL_44_17]OGX04972.1 MAG: hypothetical protein A3J12_02045 [Omnitrophica bacterium RIFCSPLOWO2_02_FULL_44_11]